MAFTKQDKHKITKPYTQSEVSKFIRNGGPKARSKDKSAYIKKLREKDAQLKIGHNLRTMRLKGKTYSIDSRFVPFDPFVKGAFVEEFGGIPKELKGFSRSCTHNLQGRLTERLRAYDSLHTFAPDKQLWAKAVDITHAAFKLSEKVVPSSLEEVPFVPNSSAGYTYLGTQTAKKADAIEDALERAKMYCYNANYVDKFRAYKALPPCVAYKRTQLSEVDNPKVRLVWGYPFEVTLIEGKFAAPLINAYGAIESPMFIGKNLLSELPFYIDSLFHFGNVGWLDWKGFDASISHQLILMAFGVLKSNLQLEQCERGVLDMLIEYFINTSIAFPSGRTYRKKGGIPSGSYFTQLIGSIINFCLIKYLELTIFGVHTRLRVLGDDCILSIPKGCEFKAEEFSRVAERDFGMIVNSTKSGSSSVPEEVEFLGHRARNMRVERDPIKVLRLALYPEYPVTNETQSLWRVLQILVDCGFRNWPLYRVYRRMQAKYDTEDSESVRSDPFTKYVLRMSKPNSYRVPIGWIFVHSS